MKKLIVLCIAISAFVPANAQKPIDFRINASLGFSDPDGNKNIIVNFPDKTAHEIYTMMATNIGILYYEPNEVMYGVQDALISVSGFSSDFCRNGAQKWSAKYILKFIIKEGKVLVLNPKVLNLTDNKTMSLSAQKLTFVDFINKYWYNRELGQFASSESTNMSLCESEINSVTNRILGITPLGILPTNW